MSRTMSHEEAREALAAAALDALPEGERRAVLAHAAGCAECGAELAALREATASMALLASGPGMEPARVARVRERLMGRIRGTDADSGSGERKGGIVPIESRRRRGWVRLAIAAGVLAVIGVNALVGLNALRRMREAEASLVEVQQVEASRLAELSLRLARQSEEIAELTGPAVSVIQMSATATKRPAAKMFRDRATNRWTMYAHNLAPLPAGKTYQLWLVTKAGEKISAGTFDRSATGDAAVHATYDLGTRALAAIAVTVEPAGGVKQPTGPVVILGEGGR